MKKNILSVLVITFTIVVYTSCEKEEEESNNVVTPVECKTCGTFITFDDTVTDEEIAEYEEMGIVGTNEEYCGNDLIAFEADLADNGGPTTTDEGIYTLTVGCQ